MARQMHIDRRANYAQIDSSKFDRSVQRGAAIVADVVCRYACERFEHPGAENARRAIGSAERI